MNEAKKDAYDTYIDRSSNKCKSVWQVVKNEICTDKIDDVNIDPNSFNSYCIQSVDNIINKVNIDPVKAKEFCNSAPKFVNSFVWRSVGRRNY